MPPAVDSDFEQFKGNGRKARTEGTVVTGRRSRKQRLVVSVSVGAETAGAAEAVAGDKTTTRNVERASSPVISSLQ
jgi:hypothetical protein